jgi:hypothetical protein
MMTADDGDGLYGHPDELECGELRNTSAYANIATEVKNQQADVLIVCEMQNNDGDQTSFSSARSSSLHWPHQSYPACPMASTVSGFQPLSGHKHDGDPQIRACTSIYKIVVSLSNGQA